MKHKLEWCQTGWPVVDEQTTESGRRAAFEYLLRDPNLGNEYGRFHVVKCFKNGHGDYHITVVGSKSSLEKIISCWDGSMRFVLDGKRQILKESIKWK